MYIVDVIIILLLLTGIVLGLKRGVFKQSVKFFGTILVFVLAFIFKSHVSNFFLEYFPIFEFEGITSLNIFLYETVAFIILLVLFFIILSLLVFFTGLLEKLLKATVILGIVSKVLGAIVGFLQYYFLVYILLLILVNPLFNFKFINDSKLKDVILNNTFIFSKYSENIVNSFEEIKTEIGNIEVDNEKIYGIIIDNNLISEENIEKFKNRSEKDDN